MSGKIKKWLKWYFYTMLFIGVVLMSGSKTTHAAVLLNTVENSYTTSTYSSPPNWYFVIKASSTLVASTTGDLWIKWYGDYAVQAGTPSLIFSRGTSQEGGTNGSWRGCSQTYQAIDGGTVCHYFTGSNVYGTLLTPDTLQPDDTIEFQLNNAHEAPRTGANTISWSGNSEVYSLQTCIATASSDVSGVGCPGNGPTPPSIAGSFAFPAQSSTIPDFTNWVINLQANTSTPFTDYFKITYWTDSQGFTSSTAPFNDYTSVQTNSTSSFLWAFPKSRSLFSYQNNNVATATWFAQLDESPDTSFLNLTHQITISFTISPTLTTTTITTSTSLAGPFFWNPIQQQATFFSQTIASSSAILAAQCQKPDNSLFGFLTGEDLRYAMCSIVNYLIVPDPNVETNYNDSVANAKRVPPFSWLFATTDILTTAVSSTPTTTDMIFDGPAVGGGTTTYTLYTASTFNTVPEYNQARTIWFNFVLSLFMLFLLWALIIILKP